ncbi:MAG TPA: 16S rRNA (cytidine(1402)-2'-O)-methyltransferase [Candidatus Paceibacterota bacterium]|jgi:16S rRNA (cytidine1402-2'-O)-methyltransferase|nr:16S rRNA (cytidine(1402)-2'-O)-methyltransferase [Candidatus Paceibacterota bacterium]
MNNIGTLYIVATPIGNLEDITLRALRILKEVDYILCEDTLTTKKLLDRYDIKTKTISYHAHSTIAKESSIINMLKGGKNLALVSDAGTPCISDPGVLLVANVRKELGASAQVTPIPGPSAVISALSASGIPSSEFVFLGFLPHKKGRETLFKEIAISKKTVVFYESTHRIMKTFAKLDMYSPDCAVVVAREITKQFEQFIKGTPKEMISYFSENKDKQRGEFVVIVHHK